MQGHSRLVTDPVGTGGGKRGAGRVEDRRVRLHTQDSDRHAVECASPGVRAASFLGTTTMRGLPVPAKRGEVMSLKAIIHFVLLLVRTRHLPPKSIACDSCAECARRWQASGYDPGARCPRHAR
ncbi:hypothetical protein GCM10029964_011970 [Kibdelosporangium lantanae]